ncbi:hypothetical protein KCP75_22150 [Salmonella enterica subsp. enterica]|nr:hypothetical protein KCP75_22150 [Salmonella enterica subsp. enterica]
MLAQRWSAYSNHHKSLLRRLLFVVNSGLPPVATYRHCCPSDARRRRRRSSRARGAISAITVVFRFILRSHYLLILSSLASSVPGNYSLSGSELTRFRRQKAVKMTRANPLASHFTHPVSRRVCDNARYAGAKISMISA